MFEYISGKLASLTPANAVIDCGGVGYLLEITLTTYGHIQESKEVRLWVHEVIREDAHLLFGFYSEKEREMFRLLIGISGVGAATARMALSSMTAEELSNAIAGEDVKMVQRIKGIGAKTAQRLVIELHDKVGAGTAAGRTVVAPVSRNKEEALSAMVMLGFPKPAAEKVLQALSSELTVEGLIKEALKKM